MAVALAIRPLKLGEPGALLTGLRTGMTGALVVREAATAGGFLCPPCRFAAGAWLPVALPRDAGAGWCFAVLARGAAALLGSLPTAALPWAGVDAVLRAAVLPGAALPGLRAAAALAGAGARLPALATVVGLVPASGFFTPGFVADLVGAAVRAALPGLLADLRAGLAVRTGAAFATVFFAADLTAGLVARADVVFCAALPPLAAAAADDLDRVAVRPAPLDFTFVCTLSELKRPLFFAISSHHALAAAVGLYNPCVLYQQAHIWNTCADFHLKNCPVGKPVDTIDTVDTEFIQAPAQSAARATLPFPS